MKLDTLAAAAAMAVIAPAAALAGPPPQEGPLVVTEPSLEPMAPYPTFELEPSGPLPVPPAPAGSLVIEERFEGAPETMWDGALLFGAADLWSGAAQDGRYVLTNNSAPGSAQYFYFGAEPGRASADAPATASVRVTVQTAPISASAGAGLMYRFSDVSQNYAAITVGAGGFAIWSRTEDGLVQAVASSDAPFVRPGRNVVEARAEEGAIAFYVNGAHAGGFSHPSVDGAGFGIFALGQGQFAFDDFEVYASAAAAPAAPAAPADK